MSVLDTLSDVWRWLPEVEAASRRWKIPAPTLLGLIHEESNGKEGLTSRTGAKGLTQFEPAAAATYHVNVTPGHAASQIDGAAHYLHDLGYSSDPRKALASYAAGPGNVSAGYFYADNILHKLAPLYGDAAGAGGGDHGGVAKTSSDGRWQLFKDGSVLDTKTKKRYADVLHAPNAGFTKDVADAVPKAINGVGDFLSLLVDPATWLRVLMFVGGLVIGFFALKQFAHSAGGAS